MTVFIYLSTQDKLLLLWLVIPISAEHTVLIYVYQGELAVDVSEEILKAGQLGHLIDGGNLQLSTNQYSARFLVLAALPIKEPVVQAGPFVMNTTEEIERTFQDYRNGVLTKIK